jgi:hypothetical protein
MTQKKIEKLLKGYSQEELERAYNILIKINDNETDQNIIELAEKIQESNISISDFRDAIFKQESIEITFEEKFSKIFQGFNISEKEINLLKKKILNDELKNFNL